MVQSGITGRAGSLVEPQPDEPFIQQVNNAFKNYHSILALSRSPLANSQLIAPALIRDVVAPSADERGNALRLLLQWAVDRLAPEPPRCPLGIERPYDDPTWRDPRWWRYNILRHRYLEPLHPDEFIEGGRYTETLIALTGIPSADSFFEERNRAIREAAAWLRQQAGSGAANEVLRQMALEETLRLLQSQPAAHTLLSIAATFEEVFPRALLLQIAHDEHISGVEPALAYLVTHRLLLTDNLGADLVLSSVLRAYLYERQPDERLEQRHLLIARYYVNEGDLLTAAEHWQKARQWHMAARTLFNAAPELINEGRIGELCAALAHFQADQLEADEWRETQILLSDLSHRLGRREEALAACRRALKATPLAQQQARIYRRMGKLYEQHNQLHALGYYRQAETRFAQDDPELITLLKDRAWLHILRREWREAEADLSRALAYTPTHEREGRADIFDALASLHRQQQRFAQAGEYARAALALREEMGDLPRIADSFQVLGLLYSAMADHSHALAAFEEALNTYRKLGNEERSALALLNIGMAHHLAGRRREAIMAYNACLTISQKLDLRLIAVRARYNLSEALAELGESDAAWQHWHAGYRMAVEAAFDDELRDLEALRTRFSLLDETAVAAGANLEQQAEPLDEIERHALAIAARQGQVTPKTLMAELEISKATATRRLAELARRGRLRQQGQGRATSYVPAGPESGAPATEVKTPRPTPSPEPADPGERLREQAHLLSNSYHIQAVGIIKQPPAPSLRLLIDFRRPLEVATFFALEQQLGELLGCTVDLIPADRSNPPAGVMTWIELKEASA